MANFFKTDLGGTTAVDLSLVAVNKYGDQKLYFRIVPAANYILQPEAKIRVMIAPSSAGLVEATAIPLLKTGKNDITNGYFFVQGGENNTSVEDILSFNDIVIQDKTWENQTFRLYWLTTRGTDELYGENLTDIYSLPHNIQGSEVVISGNMINAGTAMQYRLFWDSIANEGSLDYGSEPTDGPYCVNVVHGYAWSRGEYGTTVSGFTNPIFYPSGIMTSGIVINVPFYDERRTQQLPAIYKFRLWNVTADSTPSQKFATTSLDIEIDHGKLIYDNSKSFNSLDEYVFNTADKKNLVKINEIPIEENVIDRKRLSIGINDISIKDNSYVKQGIYVSPAYPLDFNIYTFSLRVDEFIPNYPNIDPYNVVKYFVEFNSNKWEAISPINRKDEIVDNQLIPKLFILDKAVEDAGSQVKYSKYDSNVNTFRIKIVFDLSSISDERFIPPEIRDYKCIVYDKDQFFNL